jgi:hypothetical protein
MRVPTENGIRRRQSAADGAVFYLPIEPCPKCGDHQRYVLSNQCITCTKERANKSEISIRAIAKKAREKKAPTGAS